MLVDAGVGAQTVQYLGQARDVMLLGTGDVGNNAGDQRCRGPLLEYVDRTYPIKLRPDRHRRNRLNLTFADGHGGSVQRVSGNPFNPTRDNDSSVMLPSWQYLPKVRVSPYEVGPYPSP